MIWTLLAIILVLLCALSISLVRLRQTSKAQHNQAEQIDLLHKAIQGASAGVFYYHVETNETYWDNNTLKMFGLDGQAGVIPAGTWERLIHPDDRERALSQVMNVLNGKDQLFTHNYRIRQDSGEIRWIKGTGYVVRDRHQRSLKISGFHFDITQQMANDQALRESEHKAVKAVEAKANFLANMSHEIRTPMNAIVGMIELLNQEKPSTTQQRYLNTLQNSSDVLLRIINDILDVSKIEAGKLTLEHRPFNVREVLQQCLSVYTQVSEHKDIMLAGRVDSRVPLLMQGDSTRLQQILMNLIGNAFKFTESGHILVRVTISDRHWLKFSVEDTGIGIQEEARQKLFERFNQLDQSTTRNFGGTGLGLAIVRDIVELWGGSIDVESHPGCGSTFTFELPNQLPLRDATPSSERFLVASRHESLIMLWSEDAAAPELTWAKDTEDFEIKLQDGQFDHVVVEQRFATLPGRHFIEKARALSPSITTTLIGFETHVKDDQRHNGIDFYVARPLLLSQIWDKELWSTKLSMSHNTNMHPDYSHLRILCVDDNQSNLMVLTGMLKQLGIKPVCVSSGNQAIEQVSHQSFDLILMDYEMPDLDGPSTAKIILKQQPQLILALSAHTDERFQLNAEKSGMKGFLRKPIRLQTLIDTLAEYFPEAAKKKAETLK